MPECFGDGNGPLIVCQFNPAAAVKVCGRNGDIISFWRDNERLIFDEIRDGNFLNSDDIKFPSFQPGGFGLPPFFVRHGLNRDLVRVYCPPRVFSSEIPPQSATVNRFEVRQSSFMVVTWEFEDVVVRWVEGRDAKSENLRYDSNENAYVRRSVPRSQQDIRTIGSGF